MDIENEALRTQNEKPFNLWDKTPTHSIADGSRQLLLTYLLTIHICLVLRELISRLTKRVIGEFLALKYRL